ncbi:DUF3486 family protein [Ochrobactrum sp. MR28]|nr:DUF3486 family protein [Ochrobactrum sp. MR28]MBX8814759.1 DUF3486 family protein [Ochrobactrum sp. MR31]
MASRSGRGRLSKIDQLPEECSEIISWAAHELADRKRTQLDIFAEFRTKLIALQGETGIDFDIPSFQGFNRYSIRLAQMTRRLEHTREIAATISERFDAEASDDLTLIAAEAIKTLVYEVLEDGGEAGLSPKGAMELANALRAAVAAQSVSTTRRQKVEAEFANKAEKAIEKVAKEAGLSADSIAQLRRDFLGVRPKQDKSEGTA